jgi:hypothetical protein
MDPTSPEANNFLIKAVKLMKDLTQSEKSIKNLQSEIKIKKLVEINKNIEIAIRKYPKCVSIFCDSKMIIYMKHFFTENIAKAPAITFLRLIMVSSDVIELYFQNNLPILLAKTIERDDNKQKNCDSEAEIIEALKLISEWIDKYPQLFPKLLATTLVSFAELPAVFGFE